MFAETFANTFPDVNVLGFVDREKTGNNIVKLEDIESSSFDYMLVLSANYFDSIYADQKKVIPASKIIKVEIINNVYHFLSRSEILVQRAKMHSNTYIALLPQILCLLVTFFKLRRNSVAFVCKNFAGNNLKALLTTSAQIGKQVIFLSNNQKQNLEIKKSGIKATKLYSFFGFWKLAASKFIVPRSRRLPRTFGIFE